MNIKSLFKNYLSFPGRATRTEFWLLTLIYGISATAVVNMNISVALIGGNILILFLSVIFFILILYLFIDVMIRRFHDLGKEGKGLFIGLFPTIGPLFLLYFFCKDSQREENIHGLSPKYAKQS